MNNLILLLLCLLLGVLFRRLKVFPKGAHHPLNSFILYVSLPALSLLHIPQVRISPEVLYPLGVSWIVFLGGAGFFWLWGKWLQLAPATVGALILTAGLGNTSFVGLPVLEAFYGESALQTGLLIDQGGTFVVLATLGVVVGTAYSAGSVTGRQIARRIFTFPPFLAFLAGLALNLEGWQHTALTTDVLQKLGATLTPLALVSVGLQLRLRVQDLRTRDLALGLSYKLLLAPALVYLLYVGMLGAKGRVIQICVVEAAMAPMITGAILAGRYGLHPGLANLLVGLGIPLSLLTLLGWYYLMQGG